MMWSFKKIVLGEMLMLGAFTWADGIRLGRIMGTRTWIYENGKEPVSYAPDDADKLGQDYPEPAVSFDVYGEFAQAVVVPLSMYKYGTIYCWRSEHTQKTYVLIRDTAFIAEELK